MIANDQQLQATLDGITWFQNQVARSPAPNTNPVNDRAAASGFHSEIDLDGAPGPRILHRPPRRESGRPTLKRDPRRPDRDERGPPPWCISRCPLRPGRAPCPARPPPPRPRRASPARTSEEGSATDRRTAALDVGVAPQIDDRIAIGAVIVIWPDLIMASSVVIQLLPVGSARTANPSSGSCSRS